MWMSPNFHTLSLEARARIYEGVLDYVLTWLAFPLSHTWPERSLTMSHYESESLWLVAHKLRQWLSFTPIDNRLNTTHISDSDGSAHDFMWVQKVGHAHVLPDELVHIMVLILMVMSMNVLAQVCWSAATMRKKSSCNYVGVHDSVSWYIPSCCAYTPRSIGTYPRDWFWW